MKQRLIIAAALLLLLAFVAWMLGDLFRGGHPKPENPYDYNIGEIRKSDSAPAYTEAMPLKPSLEKMTALAADASGRIFVAGLNGVEIFAPSGRPLSRFELEGMPTGMAITADGLIALSFSNHIEIRTPDGVIQTRWESPDTATLFSSVTKAGEFIYAADAGKKTVYRYSSGGKLLGRMGDKDPERKIPGFVVPGIDFDLATSPAGELWIVNPGRHKIEKYDHDGDLLKSWGETSLTEEGFSGCCNPIHIAFLPDGAFVTSEKGIERVKVYNADGSYRCLVAGPDAFDEGTRGMDLATGVNGRILMLDPVRNQVRIFLPNEM